MKYYVVTQINPTGNGFSKSINLLINVTVENGGIHGIKVGDFDWDKTYIERRDKFNKVEPADFFIIGNAKCEECKYDPF